MKLDINSFSENLIDFECHKLFESKTLWINSSNALKMEHEDLSQDYFIDLFSYANKKSGCFIDIDFDDKNKKILQAERYGGIGIGGNGGGVRCGNDGPYQLKGIGINPLLGDHGDYNHSTGNYSLTEAICEVINSQVYTCILPVGVAHTYGLLSTGSSRYTGDPYRHKLPLAIMVRETCLRPAHFLPQPFFKPFSRYKSILKNDTARVRAVNKELARKFENNNAFIMYLGKFLSASANQLAYAKVFRISHGAYSPSNVCFDGRWLDLTNMSMVPTGTNYAAAKDTVPFLSEVQEPINIVQQVVYNYSKYNLCDLNIAPLVNYYYEQFNAYFLHYLIGIFGINHDDLKPEVATEARKVLGSYIAGFIDNDRQISVGLPNASDHTDILQSVIEKLFVGLMRSPVNGSENTDIHGAFLALFSSAYDSRKIFSQTMESFLIKSMIASLRKLYFSSFFYLGRIKKHINYFSEAHSQDEICQYIDDYSTVAEWLFDKCDTNEKILICKTKLLKIEYFQITQIFSVYQSGEKILNSSSSLDVLNYIINLNESYFEIAGYNFKSGIFRLLEMLSNTDSFQSTENSFSNAGELSPSQWIKNNV